MANTDDPQAVPVAPRTNSTLPGRISALAIAALVLAILGTIGFFTLDMRAILLPLTAIVLAILALRRMRSGSERGRWIAIAAIIIAAITPIAVLLLAFGLFAASLAHSE